MGSYQVGIDPLKYLEYRVYGDLIIVYPKPYPIYLRGTMHLHKASMGALGFYKGYTGGNYPPQTFLDEGVQEVS